jgi:hypothetical protein
MSDIPRRIPHDVVQEVDNPAELLRNEDGMFEVTSPFGCAFWVMCRPGTKMTIREISEPKVARKKEEGKWRIRRINSSVA